MRWPVAAVLLMVGGCGGAVPSALDLNDSAFDSSQVVIDDTPGRPTQHEPPAPAPPDYEFDGLWMADGTLDARQDVVGPTRVFIAVVGNRPMCVAEAPTDRCHGPVYLETGERRPVTVSGGLIRIEFTMPLPPCLYDNLEALRDESLVDVTIVGIEIPSTDGRVFDVGIEQRYVFSAITLFSSATLEQTPGDAEFLCVGE